MCSSTLTVRHDHNPGAVQNKKTQTMHHNHKTVKKAILMVALGTLAALMVLYISGEISSPTEKLGFYSAALAAGALALSQWLQLKKTA